MSATETEVREFILALFSPQLEAQGLAADDVTDDFDLLVGGVIDSLGILELLSALETRFGVRVDLEEIDVDDVTTLGPLSTYVATSTQAAEDATGAGD